jgi:predicted metal-dependent enzyme (double-stranded beta helix superfamily)
MDEAPSEDLDDSPAAFIADAVELLAKHGATDEGFGAVGARLRRLARQPGIVADEHLAALHGSAAAATVLHEGADGTYALLLGRFPAEAPTPVHNHNTWGIACVVQGRDRYLRWERRDDGTDPTRADLELAEERELGPGDVVWFHGPPHDIHSQQGIGGAAWELVFFGTNPNNQPRAYFDPERGTVTYARATQ